MSVVESPAEPEITPLPAPAPPLQRARRFAREVALGFYRHHSFDHAATMSFYFFLGSIPLLVFVGYLFGALTEQDGVQTLTAPLHQVMPPAAAALVEAEVRAMGDGPGAPIAPLSLLGFLVLTSNGVHNLMDVFEMVLGAPSRPWWKQRLLSIGWVLLSLLVVLLTVWLVVFWDHALHGDPGESGSRLARLYLHFRRFLAGTWQRVGIMSVFLTVMALTLAAFFRVSVRHPREIRRRVWPGTLAAILGWMLVSWAFGKYVATIGHYAVYYGSLAAVATLLFWLYLSSLAVLLGAEVNAHLEGVRVRAPPSGR